MLRAKEDIKLDGPEGEIIEKGSLWYQPAVLQSLLENEQGFDIVKDTFEKVLKEKEEKDVTPRSISDFSGWLDKQKAMDESTEGD